MKALVKTALAPMTWVRCVHRLSLRAIGQQTKNISFEG